MRGKLCAVLLHVCSSTVASTRLLQGIIAHAPDAHRQASKKSATEICVNSSSFAFLAHTLASHLPQTIWHQMLLFCICATSCVAGPVALPNSSA